MENKERKTSTIKEKGITKKVSLSDSNP